MYKDGLYGFKEPTEFHSVVELIDYYREHSLYSPNLDTALVKPISRLEWSEMEQEEEESVAWDMV